jgi:putative transposase
MKKTRHSIRLRGYDYRQAGAYFITICTQNRICFFGDIADGKMMLNDAGRMVEHWYRELESKFPGVKCGTHVTMPNHFHAIIHITGTGNHGIEGEHTGSSQRDVGMGDRIEEGEHTGMGEHTGLPLRNAGTGDRTEEGEHTGSPLRNKTDDYVETGNEPGLNVGADQRVCPNDRDERTGMGEHTGLPLRNAGTGDRIEEGEHTGSPLRNAGSSLKDIVQWFKTMTTNAYIRGVKECGWPPFIGKLWQRNYYEHIIRDDHEFAIISNYIESNPANWNTDDENPLMINPDL